jgi:hypothetical protein
LGEESLRRKDLKTSCGSKIMRRSQVYRSRHDCGVRGCSCQKTRSLKVRRSGAQGVKWIFLVYRVVTKNGSRSKMKRKTVT